MSASIPYQYSILRFAFDVVTEEYLNVGLAIYSRPERYFKVHILTRYQRLTNAFPTADGEFYKRYVSHLQNAFDTLSENLAVPQERLLGDVPESLGVLLGSVLQPDDSSIQFTAAKAGVTSDLAETFEYLVNRLVERYASPQTSPSRQDDEIWNIFRNSLQAQRLLTYIRAATIRSKHETLRHLNSHILGRTGISTSYIRNHSTWSKREVSEQRPGPYWELRRCLARQSNIQGSSFFLASRAVTEPTWRTLTKMPKGCSKIAAIDCTLTWWRNRVQINSPCR